MVTLNESQVDESRYLKLYFGSLIGVYEDRAESAAFAYLASSEDEADRAFKAHAKEKFPDAVSWSHCTGVMAIPKLLSAVIRIYRVNTGRFNENDLNVLFNASFTPAARADKEEEE